jgi:MFS family permease
MAAVGLLAGFRLAVLVTMFLATVAILLQQRYYRLPPPSRHTGSLHPVAAFQSMSGDLKRLLLADCLIRIGSRLYITFIPLYVLNVLGRGLVEWGSLQALIAITSIVMYIPVSKLADRAGRDSRRPFVTITFLLFAAFPMALMVVPSPGWLVPAFILAGLREFGEPARKALIMDLAGPEGLGRQMGMYYTVRGIAMSGAPLVGGLLWSWNRTEPFWIGGLVSASGLLWFVLEGWLFPPGK